MTPLNEEAAKNRANTINKVAEQLYDKYRKQMDLLEKSTLCKVRGSLQPMDVYGLGKQLEQWDDYFAMCEEQGNVNLLGKIPTVAYDVITAVHGASIIPIISSVQPIEEERGIVYFKTVRAANTKGSQTAADVLVDPRVNIVTPNGYSNNSITNEVAATGDGSTKTFSYTVAALPVRSETMSVTLQDSTTVYAQDVGASSGSDVGQILGAGVWGTVNYVTGAVSLTFGTAPVTGKSVFVSYQQNYELSTDIPQIDSSFASQTIQAKIYALKGTVGLLQSFGMLSVSVWSLKTSSRKTSSKRSILKSVATLSATSRLRLRVPTRGIVIRRLTCRISNTSRPTKTLSLWRSVTWRSMLVVVRSRRSLRVATTVRCSRLCRAS